MHRIFILATSKTQEMDNNTLSLPEVLSMK